MTQEDKELLFQDLCCRLPYGIKCSIPCEPQIATIQTIDTVYLNGCVVVDYSNSIDSHFPLKDIKPYLRPMSSMTDEERIAFDKLFYKWHDDELFDYIEEGTEFSIWKHKGISPVVFDWLNQKMFDYRGLIPMGLALEALEGMYN